MTHDPDHMDSVHDVASPGTDAPFGEFDTVMVDLDGMHERVPEPFVDPEPGAEARKMALHEPVFDPVPADPVAAGELDDLGIDITPTEVFR